MSTNLLAKQYQKKTDKQHILDNPDTYIGSVENLNQECYIYDPENNYEDFLIEDILQRAYGDGIIDLDPSALTYKLDSLYTLWKAPKNPLK